MKREMQLSFGNTLIYCWFMLVLYSTENMLFFVDSLFTKPLGAWGKVVNKFP